MQRGRWREKRGRRQFSPRWVNVLYFIAGVILRRTENVYFPESEARAIRFISIFSNCTNLCLHSVRLMRYARSSNRAWKTRDRLTGHQRVSRRQLTLLRIAVLMPYKSRTIDYGIANRGESFDRELLNRYGIPRDRKRERAKSWLNRSSFNEVRGVREKDIPDNIVVK